MTRASCTVLHAQTTSAEESELQTSTEETDLLISVTMHVDRMRRIDFFVGVPLCFLVSTFIRPFLKKPALGECQNALFIELSEMGSSILVDPAMKKLRAETSANLHFVIFDINIASLKLLNTVPKDNIFTIRIDSLFHLAVDSLKLFLWCRKRKIDTVIDLELFSRFTALLTSFCGAKNRVGFYGFHNEGLYRGDMLTHKVSYNPHIHIAKNFISLVNAVLSKGEENPYSKTVVEDSEVRIDQPVYSEAQKSSILEKVKVQAPDFDSSQNEIILVNANASDMLPQRRWMPENFAKVIQTILNRYPSNLVLLTGSPSESAWIDEIRKQVGSERCINFCGGVTFEELPILYNVSKLMLTNDSGPAHFASMTSMPVFVIFGPETPKIYGSLGNFTPIYANLACSPCVSAANHRKTACTDNVCLKVITPEQVVQALTPTLEEKNRWTPNQKSSIDSARTLENPSNLTH